MADDIAAFLRAITSIRLMLGLFDQGSGRFRNSHSAIPTLPSTSWFFGNWTEGTLLGEDPRIKETASHPEITAEDFLFLFFGRSEKAIRPV